ncbi:MULTISPECIES: sigma-70 family RNA polymerase sigma factor [Nosocomiicoccus]|uniref:sigma-70 family RNA polymerase sigma factor n=1 Tax=Nosocomiicoccus TaxID=489909 RepID=UPI00082A3DB2|nr:MULTISPECIES: sigma-70 family RNA polymerase sigma factor [Nosocomiicoccus]OFL49366.1 hypothetical protein HMPREF2767_06165 [Nosocomiicoccus sp. HMSC067E10]OFO49809.1 hypothetical protein HMPREF3029_08715 [Nosocomiicoccus sp. HMSC059G07]OFS61538.1 hypothetical protein HMPREF3177_07655 [Nosocomiicoccus sp. HMSC09A07]
MYNIRSFLILIYEDSKLNEYVEHVKNGKLDYFDKIDEAIRLKVRKMTYKHTRDPYEREDLEQMIMEYLLHACFRYDKRLGDFHNYAIRSAYLELKKRSVYFYRLNSKETTSNELSNYVCDKVETYDRIDQIINRDQYSYMLQDKKTFSEYERAVLKYLGEHYTFDEISEKLKTNRKSIQNTLYRVLRKKEKQHGVY